jgi:hypothetical protein
MPRISVICATAPRPNPGMASVDLGFHSFRRRHDLPEDVTYWQVQTAEELHQSSESDLRTEIRHREKLPFTYECMMERFDEALASDVILFWGDFLHMAHYQQVVGERLANTGAVSGLPEGEALCRRYLLLEGAPDEALAKSISFGTNLLFNVPGDLETDDYGRPAGRFLSGVRRIWMRDPFSALTVGRLRGSSFADHLGLDCSLLLQPEDEEDLPRGWKPGEEEGGIGVFFGRTLGAIKPQLAFARALGGALGITPRWLRWRMGGRRGPPSLPRRLVRRFWSRGFEEVGGETAPTPGDLFDAIRRFRLIVTDIYHLCLNSWRLGIPAICIADVMPDKVWDVSTGPEFWWRDKRWTFYAMNDALPFFVHLAEAKDAQRRRHRVEGLVEILDDPRAAERVLEAIRCRREEIEAALAEEIRTVVAGE